MRTLIPSFRAADPLILVGLDDHPPTVFGHLRQHEPLILSGLVVAAHAQVDRSASAIGAHSSARSSLWNYSAMIPPIPKLSNYPHGNGAMCRWTVVIRGGLSFAPSGAALPTCRLVHAMEAVDARPLRPCNSPPDGVEQPGVRKKSLYTGDISDMNLAPEIRSGSRSSTSSMNGRR